jgi:hypothetical protein
MHAGPTPDCFWHDDIDSLAFTPRGYEGVCVVHRLAFRTLLERAASPYECELYFVEHRDVFERAAARKIATRELVNGESFHLNSRDLSRAERRVQ